MKVEELRKELEKMRPDQEVWATSGVDFQMCWPVEAILSVQEKDDNVYLMVGEPKGGFK